MGKNIAIAVLVLIAGFERYQVSTVNTALDAARQAETRAAGQASSAQIQTMEIGRTCTARLTAMSQLLTKEQDDLEQTRQEVVQVSAAAAQANASAAQANVTATQAQATAHPILTLASRLLALRP